MWRIAIPTTNDDGLDAPIHEILEEAPYLTIVEVEDKEVKKVSVLRKEDVDQDIPQLIRKKANIVMCKQIDSQSRAYFSVVGLEIIDGVGGKVREAVEMFLNNEISPIPQELREEWGI